MQRAPRRAMAVLVITALLPAALSAQTPPRTGAEIANFERHTSHDELMQFLHDVQALASDRMLVRHLTTTGEGRNMPLVLLGAPPAESPATALFSGRPTVFITGNVHGNERAGREGTLQLIRELTLGAARPLLDRVNVLIVPTLNPDGAENRTRTNTLGYDMNRDFIVTEAPEIRAIVDQVLMQWWPDVYVDVHNGGAYPYNLTYQATLHPGADAALVAFARGPMYRAVHRHLAAQDMSLFWYSGPRRDQETGEWAWYTTPPWARKQHSYGGLQNMVTLLYEIPGRWPLREQADNAREGMIGLLQFVADSSSAVRRTVAAARQRAITGADPVVVTVEQSEYPEPEQFYVIDDGEPRLVSGPNRTLFVATVTRPRPWAYAFDGNLHHVAELLQRHNIGVERLDAPVPAANVEKYRLTQIEWATSPYQNHLNADATVETVTDTMTLPAGMYVARMSQPGSRLLAELMEPDTDDSVLVWNLLDHGLPSAEALARRAQPFFLPIYRVTAPASVRSVLQ